MNDPSFLRLKNAAARALAVPLDCYKDEWVLERLAPHLALHGNDRDRARREFTARDRAAGVFSDGLTRHTTAFYRDAEQFELLRLRHLPRLLERSATLRAWSVGCANGAEAYSLGMLAVAARPGPTHSVVGTDTHRSGLTHAQRGGPYPLAQVSALPAELAQAHLRRRADGFHAGNEVRRHVRFLHHDALTGPVATDLDLVTCRNVAIYLSDAGKRRLAATLVAALRPGGVLFTGAADAFPRTTGLRRLSACFWERE